MNIGVPASAGHPVSQLMPFPSARNNIVQLIELALPAELALYLFRTRDQHSRVAWTPLRFFHRNRGPGYAAHRLDHLANGEAVPIADVVDQPVAIIERFKGEQVRARQILYMHIVADAGAIRCRIVLPEDLDALALSQSHIQNQRNQVRLRLMRFAPTFYGSSHVEVTQAAIRQPMDPVRPGS